MCVFKSDCPLDFLYSLVAPVQSCRDVLFNVPHAVMGEVAHQHLPPQVQDFIHHMPKPVEQIPLILLWKEENGGGGTEKGRRGGKNEHRVSQRRWIKRKLTRREDKMRVTDRREDTDKEMKIYSCVGPHKIVNRMCIREPNRLWEEEGDPVREREKQTEGLKMDLSKLATVSCWFLPQMYALWSASIHQLNLISTPDSLIGHKHNQSN